MSHSAKFWIFGQFLGGEMLFTLAFYNDNYFTFNTTMANMMVNLLCLW